MRLYLLRHAEAEPGSPDHVRPLTSKGRDDIENLRVLLGLNSKFHIDRVWQSSLLRAQQTVDCLFPKKKPAVETKDFLTPESAPLETIQALEEVEDTCLLVGHNPHLTLLARVLLDVTDDAPILKFKKAGLLSLVQEGNAWMIDGYFTPRFIRNSPNS